MPKLTDLGASALDCQQPKYDRKRTLAAQQHNLFNPAPRYQLEPFGNAAYEGRGYPAAGYGQTRNKVVKLAIPKVATKDGMATVGTRIIVQGTLNTNSDSIREMGHALSGLGCHCSPIDRTFVRVLGGISLSGLGQDLTTVQQFANAIVTHAVPGSLLTRITDKLLADEKANAEAYATIQKLKLIDAQNPSIPALERAQQNSWGETNIAKFYALLLPEMQSRLAGKVTPPDYRYIKAAANPGVFTQVANFLREKVIGDAAQNLITQGLMKDSSTGLGGLGFVQFLIPIGVALIVAAGLIAWMSSSNATAAQAAAQSQLIAACASGRLPANACTAAISTLKPLNPIDWNSIAMYGAIGVGGLVALQVISSIRSALGK